MLLGQRWREMHASEKTGYVSAARKIKEEFHAAHPDAKTRCVSRKGKRKPQHDAPRDAKRPTSGVPSLHALALVGSRLNDPQPSGARSWAPGAEDYNPQVPSAASSSARFLDDDEDDLDEELDTMAAGTSESSGSGGLTLLEQLCTVAENEHTAAAQALSAFAAC